MIADIIRNINLFVQGKGYAGKIEEMTLPKLTPSLQEYKAGGMSAPVDIPMGSHEKLEADITLKAFDTDVLKLFNVNMGSRVPFVARGALQDDDGTTHSVAITMEAVISEFDMGSWKAGDEATLKLGLSLRYYRLEYDGEEIIESDPINMILRVNGQDQLADMRNALGI